MAEWQPIETAPQDGTPILIWDGSDMVCVEWYVDAHQFAGWEFAHTKDHAYFLGRRATHWMPLPTPPIGIES